MRFVEHMCWGACMAVSPSPVVWTLKASMILTPPYNIHALLSRAVVWT